MIPIVYDTLLLFMLYALYRSGREIARTGKIWSGAGFTAILVYTLNEGLRFGRGTDYNGYWMAYDRMRAGHFDTELEFGFQSIANVFIMLDIPWQGLVLLMSFVFILALLLLLKHFKESLPFSLPLFVFVSMYDTENMAKFYFAYSFLLIGISYIIDNNHKNNLLRFLFFSTIACLIHIAIIPFVAIFFIFKFIKKPLLSPLKALIVFATVIFTFQIDFMQNLVEAMNMFSMLAGRFDKYANNADYWLANGSMATAKFPGITEMAFVITIIVLSYRIVKQHNNVYIFVYNLLLIGFLLRPISIQIVLLQRFQKPFYFFQAILMGCLLKEVFLNKTQKYRFAVKVLILFVTVNMIRPFIIDPFTKNEKLFMYVWNKGKETPEEMKQLWREEAEKHSEKYGSDN